MICARRFGHAGLFRHAAGRGGRGLDKTPKITPITSTNRPNHGCLLGDLLAFSRNQPGGRRAHFGKPEGRPLSRCSPVLQKRHQEKNALVESAGRGRPCWRHEPTLAQIVFNLFSNALKICRAGRAATNSYLDRRSKSQRIEPGRQRGGPALAFCKGLNSRQRPWHRVRPIKPGFFGLFTRLEGDKFAAQRRPGHSQEGVETHGWTGGRGIYSRRGQRFWFE